MPSSHDWINKPLGVVEAMFAQNNSNPEWEEKVLEYFRGQLKEKESLSWVPSLNDVPLHYLKPNSLVKFRCLVQDMFDPEFYMGVYETVDPSTKTNVLRCGKYKDVTECGVDLNSRNTVTAERQTFYCVPIPGESPWAKESYGCSSQARVVPSTSYVPSRQKRSYEEDDDDMDTQPQKQREPHTEPHGNGDSKRQETEAPSSQTTAPSDCSSHLDLNFPLPGERGPACLVKVYEGLDSFKLNDTLEIYGILSVNPVLTVLGEEKDPSSLLLNPSESMESPEEQRAHDPPASLVPRLHMLYARPLQHNNPLLPSAPTEDHSAFVSSFLVEMASVRAELLAYLTHVLLGDGLAAEYLLLHLISNVYTRRDVLPLGKFTLNLSGCPLNSYTERLYQIIQQLVPCSYRLSMSLHTMNSMRLVPKKDYVANRLVSGALQLARNTSLFLDETQLEQGQLDSSGVRNITALGNLISWQKVDYDFSYHQMEFPCNINVLVTSEGRSLLPSDCQVPLQPQVTPPNMEEYLTTIHMAQFTSQMNKFRVYLSLARTLDYSISDEVTKAVEDDFVDMRKDDPQSVTAEDLHRMLVVARLLSLSMGQTTLSRDGWMRAKHIDMLRRSRTEQQKSLNSNEP
ncbi:mini-chromosome maintenance complex-binding protein [Salmo salar]|uniref:Mini-chromosome maintenance complex-binding protein n=2 Tax=Salmo salar TaxID=8030 RepID=MCMBP_SALSA|nr:mini-chromosome maintenance complex-binding protein [Salmo salar]B5DG51.1 RecName: Full=Mini-chromosome maintenance complex-binding protein; Short=MCM-BP; Short=MCM-binding protein [Salmo salar]ACH70725.1 chromosome 10 open reading frame 119-like [Salmo salar]|eukprot:NP_001135159.1 mini-chromosome maintenance complex-binding protein [Salmo salar]